jgi:hypothetical protein
MIARWSTDQMAELGGRHAELEGRGELAPLLETLAPDPVYEFYPLDLCMRGDETVKRFYTQFVEHFLPLRSRVEMLGQWVNETSVVQEYSLDFDIDGVRERHHVVGILYVDDTSAALGKLRGERVYSSEGFVRRLTGEMFAELVPLARSGEYQMGDE